ncbi:MAG: Spermidine/putrescine import ABC transporter ATP-binding protein PotA, partial [uncultured Acetobacteraceae bacterium]
ERNGGGGPRAGPARPDAEVRHVHGGAGRVAPGGTGAIPDAARAFRQRQDDHPDDGGRVRAAQRRAGAAGRRRHHAPAARTAPLRHGVPGLRAVSAHDGGGERGLPAARARPGPGGAGRQGARGAGPGAALAFRGAPAGAALRGPAAAGGAGPRAGVRPGAAAFGRAAIRAGQEAPRRAAGRAEGAAPPRRPHLRQRDPRPGRGAFPFGPRGDSEPRPAGPVRRPGGAVRAAAHLLRGRLPRQIELPPRHGAGRAGGRGGVGGRRHPHRAGAAGRRGPALWRRGAAFPAAGEDRGAGGGRGRRHGGGRAHRRVVLPRRRLRAGRADGRPGDAPRRPAVLARADPAGGGHGGAPRLDGGRGGAGGGGCRRV